MTCKLSRDSSNDYDALTTTGAGATLLITSQDTSAAKVTAASMNETPLEVDEYGKVNVSVFEAGANVVWMTIEGGVVGDEIVLNEACDDGTKQVLKTKRLASGGSGVDPVLGWRIYAS